MEHARVARSGTKTEIIGGGTDTWRTGLLESPSWSVQKPSSVGTFVIRISGAIAQEPLSIASASRSA